MKIVITLKDDNTIVKEIDSLCVNLVLKKMGLVDEYEDISQPYDVDFSNVKSFTVLG